MPLLPSHIQAGLWLMDGDACLGSIRPQPVADPDQPGCVQVRVWPHEPENLCAGTGLFEVRDLDHDRAYQVQALRSSPADHGWDMLVTTLGELTHAHRPEVDDDYLILEGHEPVPVQRMVVADASCARGPHVRCEVSQQDWSRMPVEAHKPRRCACGREVFPSPPQTPDPRVHTWPFDRVRLAGGSTPAAMELRLVLLRLRRTLQVQIDVAAAGDADRPVVLIGHVTATEGWPK